MREQKLKTGLGLLLLLMTVQLRIGSSMDGKTLVGEGDAFTAQTPQLVAWTNIKGAEQPTNVTHIWTVNGVVKSKVSLPVKSSSYRTWSKKDVLGETGTWTLEVKDEEGQVLATKTVEVKPAP